MKVGNYSYPLFRLSALLKDTKTLYEKFGKKEVTREHIAEVLGLTATSGGFGQKVADFRSYGLLAGSSNKYSVSDIGAKATFGTEKEKAEALDRAVRLIDLWMKISEKCGKNPIQATFWLDLADLTGVERPEAQNKSEAVLRAYLEDTKYLLSGLTQENPTGAEKSPNPDVDESAHEKKFQDGSQGSCLPSTSNIPKGCSYIYHPELPAPIVINSPRTFKAAKIFWEAIEEEWTKKIESDKAEAKAGQNVKIPSQPNDTKVDVTPGE